MIKITAKDSDNSIENLEYVKPEIWRDVPGYKGWYKVSNKGRIKRVERVVKPKSGVHDERRIKERIRKPVKIQGYNYIKLSKKGKKKMYKISRFVAKAFIPNPENKSTVNHINGIKDDDRVENIEWATRSENTQHAYDNGLIPKRLGEDHPMSVLDDEKVIEIRELYKDENTSQNDLAKKYNVGRKTIAHVVNGNTWTHI